MCIFCFRSALLKQANNKNQDFQNAVQSLDFFLFNLPNNTIKPTDNVAQITAKENSQKVKISKVSLSGNKPAHMFILASR